MAPTVAPGLRIRKLADRSGGESARQADLKGAPPGTWPSAGIQVEDAPPRVTIPTSFVGVGRAEGWISVEGEQVHHRPGGPPTNLWAVTHTFVHLDEIILHSVDGDVTYRVVHQPDKYAADGDDDTPVTDELYAAGDTRIDWFYVAELEG